jgi:uncharacterized protein YukE
MNDLKILLDEDEGLGLGQAQLLLKRAQAEAKQLERLMQKADQIYSILGSTIDDIDDAWRSADPQSDKKYTTDYEMMTQVQGDYNSLDSHISELRDTMFHLSKGLKKVVIK